ncbi:MAG: aminotransferase DegT [Azospirillum sp.]|nr:aminotransferase DegT [Azospirillum sp.]
MSSSASAVNSGTGLPPIPAAKIDFRPEDRQWIAQRIEEILASGQLTLGKYGAAFEQRFAGLIGVRHAIAVSSGTAALEIILRSLDIAGRDVLVPANTFFATAAAVVHAGGRPVLIDSDPETMGSAPEEIDKKLTAATAAVVVAHIGGLVSPRMSELVALCTAKGVPVVEDAAHAHLSGQGGIAAGGFGLAGAFSFYPTKVMTSAEGGMITTNDDRIAAEAKVYRDQGKAGFSQNFHTRLGYNWRLSEPHAVIGLRHCERLAEMVAARRHIAAIYDQGLQTIPGLLPLVSAGGCSCNYYKYIALPDRMLDRAALKATLRERFGVSLSGEVYEQPLHRQPIFADLAKEPLPIAEDLCARHLCLPIYASMTEAEAERVIAAVKFALN